MRNNKGITIPRIIAGRQCYRFLCGEFHGMCCRRIFRMRLNQNGRGDGGSVQVVCWGLIPTDIWLSSIHTASFVAKDTND